MAQYHRVCVSETTVVVCVWYISRAACALITHGLYCTVAVSSGYLTHGLLLLHTVCARARTPFTVCVESFLTTHRPTSIFNRSLFHLSGLHRSNDFPTQSLYLRKLRISALTSSANRMCRLCLPSWSMCSEVLPSPGMCLWNHSGCSERQMGSFAPCNTMVCGSAFELTESPGGPGERSRLL